MEALRRYGSSTNATKLLISCFGILMIRRFFGASRYLVERMARRRALWRRLPRQFDRTPVLVSPDARLQHLKFSAAAFDPQLLQLAIDHVLADSIVWDVGANAGVFAFAAASRAREGYVLAIEPDPWLCGLLERSRRHRRNKCLNVETLCAAVAAQPGTARLAIAARGRASNYLEEFHGRSQAGGVRETRNVPVLTLDLLASSAPPPTLIKIDVEGAEWAVLQGAREIIRKFRPTIAIEVDQLTCVDVTQFLTTLDYDLCDIKTGQRWTADRKSLANILARAR